MLTRRWPFDGEPVSRVTITRLDELFRSFRDCSLEHGGGADDPATWGSVTGPSRSAALDQRRFTLIVMRVQAASVFALPLYLTLALYLPGFANFFSLTTARPSSSVAR